MRETRGFTLLEVLIAAGVLGAVFAAAFDMFSAGNRHVVKGISTTGLVSTALVIEQRLMHDVQQMMVPSTTSPVQLDLSGTYLSFYVPDRRSLQPVFRPERAMRSTTATWCATGDEVRWHLVDAGGGYFHPTRNDKVFSDVWLKSWRFFTASPSTPPTSGSSAELDLSPHPLPPGLRKRLGFPPARFRHAGDPPDPAGSAGASGATSGTGAGATPPTTSVASTPGTTPSSAPSPYLLLQYTLVDPERKTELKRSLVWDLVNVRSKVTFGALYVMPDGILTFRPRREMRSGVEATFTRQWEKEIQPR